MSNTLLWASFAAIAIGILFLIAVIQNSVDESSIIATPSIPRESGIFSSVASIKIKASVEEVFAAISSFKDYSAETPFAKFHWKDVTADGVPRVGSTGSFKLTIDGYGSRKSPVKLTLLDRESKRLAILTTSYSPWLLASERVQEVVPVEGQPGYCEYRTWWTLEGVAAYYLLLNAKEEFEESQKHSATDLKYFLERGRTTAFVGFSGQLSWLLSGSIISDNGSFTIEVFDKLLQRCIAAFDSRTSKPRRTRTSAKRKLVLTHALKGCLRKRGLRRTSIWAKLVTPNEVKGWPRKRKVLKISNIGKNSYAKHFEWTSLADRHGSHHRIGKLSAPAVEKMLQKMLLAEHVAHQKRINDKISKSHNAGNARIRETKTLAKLGGTL